MLDGFPVTTFHVPYFLLTAFAPALVGRDMLKQIISENMVYKIALLISETVTCLAIRKACNYRSPIA